MAFSIRLFTPTLSPFKRLLATRKGAFTKLLTYYMNEAVKTARQRVTGGGTSKTMLNVRSGRLRSSITKQVNVYENHYEGILGTNVVYARIHEYGGTIKPKKGRFLTIPIRHGNAKGGVTAYSATTKAGVARWSAGDIAGASYIKGREELGQFAKEVRGNLFIFSKLKNGLAVPIFRLVTQVKIPQRPYLTPALQSVTGALAEDIKTVMESKVQSVKYAK